MTILPPLGRVDGGNVDEIDHAPVGDFDSAVIDRDGVEVEPCLCSKRADGTCIRAYVNRSAQTLLCERADVAKLAYAVVAVVAWQAMRVGDGARGLAKQR
jgi:hypothetical protein